MLEYIIKRLLISTILLILISIIIFILINTQSGNPYSYMISPNTSPALVEMKLRQIGYYDPLYIKYIKWFSRILHLDLGYSIKYSKSVISVIAKRVPNTLLLMSTSLFVSTILGVALGFFSAYKRNTKIDDLLSIFSFVGISIPVFFIALLLIKKFSYDMMLLPSSGMYDVRVEYKGIGRFLDVGKHLILPVTALSVFQMTSFIRYSRQAMLDVMDKEYIYAAMAKGMSFGKALLRHGLRNALLPIVTIFCLQIPSLFSGALLTETIFSWPGIGRLSYEAVQNRDYPLIMGVLMISAILILLSNFLADILYVYIDRRIEL